ncbi:hypothetical protein NQZ68_032129 [Dissostichus eleginoides]|nr:hypothetical protein NQZ68_032129 [Dissostichus eleginoides]
MEENFQKERKGMHLKYEEEARELAEEHNDICRRLREIEHVTKSLEQELQNKSKLLEKRDHRGGWEITVIPIAHRNVTSTHSDGELVLNKELLVADPAPRSVTVVQEREVLCFAWLDLYFTGKE